MEIILAMKNHAKLYMLEQSIKPYCGVSARKYIMKPCRETGKCFKENKDVKTLEQELCIIIVKY